MKIAKGIALLGLVFLLAAACSKEVSNNNGSANPTPTPANSNSNLQTFRYLPYNFEFQYPASFANTNPTYGDLKEQIVQIEMDRSAYPNTNFSDADFTVSADTATSQTACLAKSTNASGSGFKTQQIINGVSFFINHTEDAAAGNIYESKVLRVLRQQTCFELTETIHTTNIANYPSGTVTEIDKTPIWTQLDNIANTFKFN